MSSRTKVPKIPEFSQSSVGSAQVKMQGRQGTKREN